MLQTSYKAAKKRKDARLLLELGEGGSAGGDAFAGIHNHLLVEFIELLTPILWCQPKTFTMMNETVALWCTGNKEAVWQSTYR